jgi:hypothetical protein
MNDNTYPKPPTGGFSIENTDRIPTGIDGFRSYWVEAC